MKFSLASLFQRAEVAPEVLDRLKVDVFFDFQGTDCGRMGWLAGAVEDENSMN